MARGYARERIVSNTTGLPLANATVTVREVGTTNAIAAVMYAARTGGTTVANPITTGADGVVAFYLDVPQDVDFRVVAAGYPDATIGSVKVHADQGELVSETGAQTIDGKTFTNAVLTSPEINAATINNPSIVSGTLTGSTVMRNGEIRNGAGSAIIARFRDGVTYMPGPVQMGTDLNGTSDTAHLFYIHKSVTGSGVGNLVDAFLVEINGATSDDSDIGSVAGFARAMTATGVVSMRGVAGQMMVDLGAQKADREPAEFGMHTALAVTSKSDNRTAFDKLFGNSGVLISAYSGTQADGNAAARPNAAIAINTYGGSGGHWKEFIVAYDHAGTRAFRVDDQGNIQAGGGGNNAALGAYGFLDPNGDIDVGTDIFWAGNDAIGFAINSTELARLNANGLGVGGTAPSGSRLYVTGGLTETAGGIKNGGKLVLGGAITDTIGADQNNYAPTGIGSAAVVSVTATGAQRTITGFNVSGATAPQAFIFVNTGGQNIVLAHNSGSSSAGNLINTHTGADFTLAPGEGVLLFRTAADVWRTLGFNAS